MKRLVANAAVMICSLLVPRAGTGRAGTGNDGITSGEWAAHQPRTGGLNPPPSNCNIVLVPRWLGFRRPSAFCSKNKPQIIAPPKRFEIWGSPLTDRTSKDI